VTNQLVLYCNGCGAEHTDDATPYCPHCGCTIFTSIVALRLPSWQPAEAFTLKKRIGQLDAELAAMRAMMADLNVQMWTANGKLDDFRTILAERDAQLAVTIDALQKLGKQYKSEQHAIIVSALADTPARAKAMLAVIEAAQKKMQTWNAVAKCEDEFGHPSPHCSELAEADDQAQLELNAALDAAESASTQTAAD